MLGKGTSAGFPRKVRGRRIRGRSAEVTVTADLSGELQQDEEGPGDEFRVSLRAGYAAWCQAQGHDPADRRSRGTFVELERGSGGGRRWPPGRNELCWCGSERKYKRCGGALATQSPAASAA